VYGEFSLERISRGLQRKIPDRVSMVLKQIVFLIFPSFSMKLAASLITLAISLSQVVAVVPAWGQCGGNDWTGETGQATSSPSCLTWCLLPSTVCISGSACVYQNDWYSQCIPGAISPTIPPSNTATSPGPTSGVPSPVSTGFVKTSGTEFTLNGKAYTVVGFVERLFYFPFCANSLQLLLVATRIGWA